MSSARQLDLAPHRRGDSIYITISSVADSTGAAITLSNYTVRAVLKPVDSVTTDDSDAISTVTGGSGITISGASAAVRFPASATATVTAPNTLKYEIQATLTADTDEVRTLAYGIVPIEADIVKTSP